MNIIMTGSTSFVGAATVRELLRRGHTVTAIVRPKSSILDTILEGNEEALLSGRLLVTENDLSEPEKLLEKVTKPQDVFSVIRSRCIPYSAWEPENRNFLQPRAFAVRIVSREISMFFS